MNKESCLILKNFAKKLSNCPHNVKINTLLEFLRQGKFGYTTTDDSEEVVINEFVFADDIASVIVRIRNIIKEPHIFLKRESIIQNVSVAPNIDTEALLDTYTDHKLWKVKDDAIEPEFVHAFVNEDNLAIYENRFISYLIDLLYSQVSKRLESLLQSIGTLNKLAGLEALEAGFGLKNYINILDDNNGLTPVIAESDSAEVRTLNLLIKCKKQLSFLMQTEFYIACKKTSKFVPEGLKPTNILMMDKRYNYCFLFYNNYIKNNLEQSKMDHAYASFITVNFFNALTKNGFKLEDEEAEVFAFSSGRIAVKDATFIKEPFIITVNKDEFSPVIDIDVSLQADASSSRYNINVLDSHDAEQLAKFTDLDEYARSLEANKPEGIERLFFITNIAPTTAPNSAFILPNKADTADKLRDLILTMLVVVEVSIGIHSRVCPICGSSLISPEDTDLVCSTCEGRYHLFSFGKREFAWIKTLPRPTEEPTAIYTDEEVVDVDTRKEDILASLEQEVVEEPVAEQVAEPVIEEVAPAVIEEPVAEEVIETPVEEPVAETPIEDEPIAEEVVATVAEEVIEEVVEVPVEVPEVANDKILRINKSFLGRIIQAEDDIQAFYSEVRNHLLSYKRVNGRVSWHFDSFNVGREQMAKIAIKGKTLVLYLALDPDILDEKYHAQNVGDSKKFADVPTMIKIKSDRGVKFAKQLIDLLFVDLEQDENYVAEDYTYEYMDDDKLLKDGLAKYTASNF